MSTAVVVVSKCDRTFSRVVENNLGQHREAQIWVDATGNPGDPLYFEIRTSLEVVKQLEAQK